MRPAPAPPAVQSFSCPSCRGVVQVRAPGKAIVVACEHCGSVVDAQDPRHQLLAKYEGKITIQPRIPLGKKGQLRGETYQCLGFMRRQVVIEGTHYTWSEYLLWHPQRGYRWLAEYANHWTYIKPCNGLPTVRGRVARYLDRNYDQFQTAEAETIYVLGEFYWQVRVGDTAKCADFVSPPYILSKEQTPDEVTWSIGEYLEPAALWKAFELPGAPPEPRGVAPAEPSPYQADAQPMFNFLVLLLGVATLIQGMGLFLVQNKQVLQQSFTWSMADAEKSRVSEFFALGGRTSNVEIQIKAPVDNNWAYFDLALINHDTGQALDLGREVEYFHGYEDGESWSEGGQTDEVILPSVPPGNYYLRIEPETPLVELPYTITVTRDAPRFVWYPCAVGLVLLPYLWFWHKKYLFEYNRWSESDYPWPGIGTSDE